jgi:N-acetylneuraminic acid mutarotase
MSLDVQIVYDIESDSLLHYGGWIPEQTSSGYSSIQSYSNESWIYNFTSESWQNLEQLNNPGPRFSYSIAYDIASDLIVLFGGASSEDEYRGDTWSFDMNTNTWTNMSPVSSPGVRFGASMVYDSESDVIILFGGLDFPELFGHHVQQTWVYDLDTNIWTNMEPTTQPIGRHHASMTYDTESDRVILFGGYVSSAVDEASSDTWSYDYNTNTWVQMDPDSNPEGRFYGALTYDNSSDRAILYGGGWDYSTNSELGDTWAYDSNSDSWELMSPDPHPPERWRHSMTYRAADDSILLIGGSFGDIEGGERRSDAFWEYNYENDSWSNLDDGFNPSIPGAPENPLVIAIDSAFVITWEPPSNETGQAITGYNIYRGTEETSMELYASLGDVLFYQDIGMNPGITYFYSITAITPAGEGTHSEIFTVGIPAPFPIFEVSIVTIMIIIIVLVYIRRQRASQM